MAAPPATGCLVLLGSARKQSDTRRLAGALLARHPHQLLDLLDYPITHYHYEHQYPPADAFAQIVEQVLAHGQLVLATPVYWYTMSGHLKVFLDRLTDLITAQKDQGRKLRGKSIAVLAVGVDAALPPGFEEPFRLTARYLGMHYLGATYCPVAELGNQELLVKLRHDLEERLKGPRGPERPR